MPDDQLLCCSVGFGITDVEQSEQTHVLLNEVQTSIIGHEGCNLLAILDKLHSCALSDGRIGLLGLNTTANSM